nr:PREDICTED: LOW QUALITY PROTEIN: probable G-protein coupled receptor [Phalacrocorax carbo]
MQEKSPCCPGTGAAGLVSGGMASQTGLNTTDYLEPLSVPEQSIAQEVVSLLCMVLLTLIALVANTVVMVVILKTPLLRKFIFVCHLCVVDLLSAIFLMPLGIISSSSCFNRVIYSIAECQALIFLNVCFISASILTISIISVERYYYIVHPMRYEVKMTIRLAVAGVIFIWVKSVLITVLALVGWPQGNGATSASRCTVYWSPGAHKKVFVIIFSIICFVLPTIIIFAVYCSVYRVARMASLQHVPVCLNQPLGQELCLSVSEASVQENFLQFLQRATCTLETHASCISPSPRNRLDQTKMGFPIPGQVPEESS